MIVLEEEIRVIFEEVYKETCGWMPFRRYDLWEGGKGSYCDGDMERKFQTFVKGYRRGIDDYVKKRGRN